jgi:hypothetical protein
MDYINKYIDYLKYERKLKKGINGRIEQMKKTA